MNTDIFLNTLKKKGLYLNVNIIALLCAFFLFCGCQEKKLAPKSIPNDVISKDSMISILKDLYTLEGAYFQNTVKPYVTQEAEQQYAWIFKKYSISAEKFSNSLSYYQKDAQYISEIYDQILEQLSIDEAKTNSITPTP